MLDLTGKVAFITGAGSAGEGWGNGKAIAVLMARQGAKVFGVDLSGEALEATSAVMAQEGHENWATKVCNMTDSGQVKAAVDSCRDKFGRIDILVNNVGGSAPGDPVNMSEEAWDNQMELNLKTAFMGCKHVLPVMEQQFAAEGKGGAIINMASVACLSAAVGGRVHVAYAASKAGVVAFTRSTAIAYVKKGIRVNVVIPGTMHTPLVENRLIKQLNVKDPEAFIAKRHASIPIGRMGDAWDIANAVVYLSSDEAGYITATQLVVDGGLTAAR
ncbi:SDR family oxidoreductase [Rhizobium leguminosarum]|uniref:SDR family NAD(P)-dependent oxidoreductase n=1 Tax=Rhizobium leguminosarum TaxID=384 RepID=UPI00102FA58F|nr:SDR family NAD(P)-dependent oxidoreductase [Rhizobium leguminosarum]QIO75783.1 SDR family oxidoreductase [Rhizobium leguminosarum bv. trifolii]QIO82794.1 SDR family oxidoreductase [Rhizobium leguminosarum bv. trifolii]TAX49691.1 SDR family oxidoreductase [Rhizobium leguminosarum]